MKSNWFFVFSDCILFCVILWAVLLNSLCFYVVRTCEYHGDLVELRDPGNVPALWEHRLLLRPVPNTTGAHKHTRTSTHKHIFWHHIFAIFTPQILSSPPKVSQKPNLRTFFKKASQTFIFKKIFLDGEDCILWFVWFCVDVFTHMHWCFYCQAVDPPL